MNNIINQIQTELEQAGDAKTRKIDHYFFKEPIKSHGVNTLIVKSLAKRYFKQIKNKNKSEIFNLCEKLWHSGYIDETHIACEWSYAIHKDFKPEDFKTFERWVSKYVSNWAACDTLCNHTVGTLVEMYPEFISDLKRWARSSNRWMRRASAVTLIIPARHGKFLNDIFKIADTLLIDKDDLVQKGYGWMLKAASQAHEKEVFNYVIKNKGMMPRTALRYAIEKMPKELKMKAMEK